LFVVPILSFEILIPLKQTLVYLSNFYLSFINPFRAIRRLPNGTIKNDFRKKEKDQNPSIDDEQAEPAVYSHCPTAC
jgi:hypothetical protein